MFLHLYDKSLPVAQAGRSRERDLTEKTLTGPGSEVDVPWSCKADERETKDGAV